MAWNPSLYELTVTLLANAVLAATTQRSVREATASGVGAHISGARRPSLGTPGMDIPIPSVQGVLYEVYMDGWLYVCVSVCLWYI